MSQDPYRRQRILWFITMNLMGIVVAALLFVGFLYGDGIDAIFGGVMRGILEQKLLVVLIAMSPLVASLLVGMAYAQRAIRRKKAERQTASPSALGSAS